MTKIYGILAHPARHSLSPAIFNAAFVAEKIDARYEVFDEPLEVLPRGRKISRLENSSPGYICGLSISLPYKESILEFLDEMSEDVRAIGACNTVKIERDESYNSEKKINRKEGANNANNRCDAKNGKCNKKAIGFNTDWIGFMDALKEKVATVKDLNVIVLGAGGAARAIVYGLVKGGAKVVVLNRTIEKAAKIAENFADIRAEIETTDRGRADENDRVAESDQANENTQANIQFGSLDEIDNFECDVLVQATSVGITNNSDAKNSNITNYKSSADFVSKEFLQKNKPLVFDIIYKPLITPLLQIALDNGCKIITGDKMLLNQAVKQFEIWFEKKAPKDIMAKELTKFIT